jgi:hypothetical protein
VLVNFVTHKSFQAMVAQTGQQLFKDTGRAAPLWAVSLPPYHPSVLPDAP